MKGKPEGVIVERSRSSSGSSARRDARFDEIYDAYSGQILAYAARRVGDPADALDIVSETFVIAWRRIDAVPPGEDARPWLYGVARRVLSNHRRGDARRRRLDARLTAEASAAISTSSRDDGPDGREIKAALAGLRADDRHLLTLVAWDGLRPDEIAAMLGCTVATVRVRLHRARKRFEDRLVGAGVQHRSSAGHERGTGATAPRTQEKT